MVSPMGSTKQALSWFMALPAFISVGLLGKNSRSVIVCKNSSRRCRASAALP